ncbi:MAG: CHASE2 domain-containing protein [Bacteroidota bacterium]
MLKKRKFWIHNILATGFIFGFMWVAGQMFAIFEFLDPIGDALEGYEMTDQVFSNEQWREVPPAEEDIVIINMGSPAAGATRRVTAEQINIINSFGPKVIGLDAIFRNLKPDTLGDFMLANALSNSPNVIMYVKLLDNGDDFIWQDAEYSHPMFTQDHKTALVNLPIENVGGPQWQYKTNRSFFPRELLRNPETNEIDTVLAFAVQVAMEYDPVKTKKFLDRNIDEEIVNYTGNVMDYGLTRLGTRFFALDWWQVLDTMQYTPDLLKDKIILMGFLGQDFDDKVTIEDKYFTPLNEKYTGRARADMFGVVIHANIVSMILNEQYIDQMTETQGIWLAILVCFLNVFLFSIIYYKMDRWYDGLTKLIQLTEALLFTFIIILVFHYFSYKLNLTLTIIAVLFAGDTLEVYYGVIVNAWERIEKKWLTK